LFPFDWRGVVIPCCPSSEIEALLDAPVPFLIGGLSHDRFPQASQVVFVDLDNDKVACADELLAALPARPLNKLLKQLQIISNEMHSAEYDEFNRCAHSFSSARSFESASSIVRTRNVTEDSEFDDESDDKYSDLCGSQDKILNAGVSELWSDLSLRLDKPITEWSSMHPMMIRDDIASFSEFGGTHANVCCISQSNPSREHQYICHRTCLAARAAKERRDAFLRFLSAVLMGWKLYLRPQQLDKATPSSITPKTNGVAMNSANKRGITSGNSSKLLQLVLSSGSVYPRRRRDSMMTRGFDAEHFLASRSDTNGRGWMIKLVESQMFSAFVAQANAMRCSKKDYDHIIASAAAGDPSPRVIPRSSLRDTPPPHDAIPTTKKIPSAISSPTSIERSLFFARDDETATEASDAVLIFDEKCTAKMNRSSLQIHKQETPFLQSNNWRHVDTYIVPPPTTESLFPNLFSTDPVQDYASRFVNLRKENYPHRPLVQPLDLWGIEAARSRSAEQVALIHLLNGAKDETPAKTRLLRRCILLQALVRSRRAVRQLERSRNAASRIFARCRGVLTRKAVFAAISAIADRLLLYLFGLWQQHDEALVHRSRLVSYSHFETPPCLGLALLIDEVMRFIKQNKNSTLQPLIHDFSCLKLPKIPITQLEAQQLAISGVRARLLLLSSGHTPSIELHTPPQSSDTGKSTIKIPRFQLANTTPSDQGISRPCATPSTTRADAVQTDRFFSQTTRPQSTGIPQRLQSTRKLFSPRRPMSTRAQSCHFAAIPTTTTHTDTSNKNSTYKNSTAKNGLYDAIKTMNPAQRDQYFHLFGLSDQRLRKRKLAKLVWTKADSKHILDSARLVLLLCENEANLVQTPADIHRATRIRRALLASAHAVFVSSSVSSYKGGAFGRMRGYTC